MSSVPTRLTDFTDTDSRKTDPEPEWPILVNGHRVLPIKPTAPPRNADSQRAFHCTSCGRTIHPPETRINDSEWVRNRFSTAVSCGTDSLPAATSD